MFPAGTDSTSSGVLKFSFNMGQKPFIGNPEGYKAYDANYDTSKLVGEYILQGIDNDIIVPQNLTTVIYNVAKSSGRYYYEVTIDNIGAYGMIGLSPSAGNNYALAENGVGVTGIGTVRDYLSYISDVRTSTQGGFNYTHDEIYRYGNYDVLSGEVLQVYIDYDTR